MLAVTQISLDETVKWYATYSTVRVQCQHATAIRSKNQCNS